MNEGQRRAFKNFQLVADELYPNWQCSECQQPFPLGSNSWSLGTAGNSSIIRFNCPNCKAGGETTLINPSFKLARLLEAWDAVNSASDFLKNSENIMNDIKTAILSIQKQFPHIDFLPNNWEELVDFYGVEAFDDAEGNMLVNGNLKIQDD